MRAYRRRLRRWVTQAKPSTRLSGEPYFSNADAESTEVILDNGYEELMIKPS
jgi:hypothetical protein